MSNRIKMRLTGTQDDLQRWVWLVEKLQERGLVLVVEKSKPYANRGESLQSRVYLEIDLLLDAPTDELKPLR
jgi:GTPase SAR1 family protein